MMRSMYSAVSGLKTHQTKMDVIGNNIANVNTVAFKSSSVVFQDVLYQMTSNASGANAATGTGGVNAKQIGLGVTTLSLIHIWQAIDVLKSKQRSQMMNVHAAERDVELARKQLNEAMVERKTHEKLKEKAFEEFKQELLHEESKEIDELVSYTYHDNGQRS